MYDPSEIILICWFAAYFFYYENWRKVQKNNIYLKKNALVTNVFIFPFDQVNASLLNKNMNLF